jgi:hypothetical protein
MMSETNEASVQSVVHTPGPWDAISHDFGRTKVWEVVAGLKAETVVELSLFSPNAEADAKLIAAAPMMLAALRRIVRHQDIIGGSMASVSSTRHIAAQAIQHATGEQV